MIAAQHHSGAAVQRRGENITPPHNPCGELEAALRSF
jgi:hypothetical protein